VYLWADSRKFVGDWKNDTLNGFGVFFWPNEEKYEGNWINGSRNGNKIESY